jgi:hypothetical protein
MGNSGTRGAAVRGYGTENGDTDSTGAWLGE